MELAPYSLEFNVFLALTITLLIGKLLLSIFLGWKVYQRTKERGEFKLDFIFGVFVLVVSLFISRLILMLVDFYLVQFNTDLYYQTPNIELWKIGNFLGMVGMAFLLWIVDKNVLKFRFKGILALIYLIAGLTALFWPVTTKRGYTLVSAIFMLSQLLTIILPVIFINLGLKVPGLRRLAFIMALGIIFYIFGVIIVSDPTMGILRDLFGASGELIAFFLFFSLKIVGLSLFTYGTAKFSL
jgi:hypothetical protein